MARCATPAAIDTASRPLVYTGMSDLRMSARPEAMALTRPPARKEPDMRTAASRCAALTLVLSVALTLTVSATHAQTTGGSRLTSDDPNNWPMYHRTYDAYRFSPLAQINKTNVKDLQVAWV